MQGGATVSAIRYAYACTHSPKLCIRDSTAVWYITKCMLIALQALIQVIFCEVCVAWIPEVCNVLTTWWRRNIGFVLTQCGGMRKVSHQSIKMTRFRNMAYLYFSRSCMVVLFSAIRLTLPALPAHSQCYQLTTQTTDHCRTQVVLWTVSIDACFSERWMKCGLSPGRHMMAMLVRIC